MQNTPFGRTNVYLPWSISAITLVVCWATNTLGADPLAEGELRRLPPLVDTHVFSEFDNARPEILPVSVIEPLSSSWPSEGTADRFPLLDIGQPNAIRLVNDFTGDPEFASGLLLIVDDVALKIRGIRP